MKRRRCLIPPRSHRPLQPVGDHEPHSFGSAVEKFYIALLFSFLRTAIVYHLGSVACVLRALASDMNVGIPWPGASVCRNFRSTWSRMKRRCMRRIAAFALAALCFATAPSCVKSQVCARDTFELGGTKLFHLDLIGCVVVGSAFDFE